MQHIHILAVGSMKEPAFAAACGEYAKRLGAYCSLTVTEIPACRLPKNPGAAEIERGLCQEGEAILARLPPKAHLTALCVEGTQLTSERFAASLDELSLAYPHAAFAIGGSHGLSEEVKQAARRKLSISAMTFPHQLARVLLLEQLYRSFSILRGGKYHK